MDGKRNRAEPLSVEKRRLSIINAVIPLLIERGASVTTKEMAEVAGIAEGTIFRVFPEKSALILDAIEYSMDPAPVQEALAQIQPGVSIEAQLTEAGMILLERFERVIALFAIIRNMPRSAHGDRPARLPEFVEKSNRAITRALTEMLESHSDVLRIEPARVAFVFRSLIFSSAHPVISGGERLSVSEIVDVLVAGVLSPEKVH